MDVVGKDGMICVVMSGINFVGCEVYLFKQLFKEEFEYDFFWCMIKWLLECGCIGIFNCSYYEEVFVVCVYLEYFSGQNLFYVDFDMIWDECFELICDFE